MKTSVVFERNLIAPCGMNYRTCIGYLREKTDAVLAGQTMDLKPNSFISCIEKNNFHLLTDQFK
jgi:hypothetical protein